MYDDVFTIDGCAAFYDVTDNVHHRDEFLESENVCSLENTHFRVDAAWKSGQEGSLLNICFRAEQLLQ